MLHKLRGSHFKLLGQCELAGFVFVQYPTNRIGLCPFEVGFFHRPLQRSSQLAFLAVTLKAGSACLMTTNSLVVVANPVALTFHLVVKRESQLSVLRHLSLNTCQTGGDTSSK
jgi:hypothetical protein